MKASAPASSANLGPGFDCLALALEIRCEVTVQPTSEWQVSPGDPTGFVEAAARQIHAEPLGIVVESAIPIGRGLGSSAALLAALTAAVRRLDGEAENRHVVFEHVSGVEGHRDNAAAAVFGGLVQADDQGVHPLDIHPSWRPVIAVPDATLPTQEARAVLPDQVPLELASRTVSRVVRLVEALRTGDSDLMRTIGEDELHEPHRVTLRPVIGDLMEAARAAGAPFAAISGAGPSVMALTTDGSVDDLVEALQSAGAAVLTPGVAFEGIR